jgi:hypothetical protein
VASKYVLHHVFKCVSQEKLTTERLLLRSYREAPRKITITKVELIENEPIIQKKSELHEKQLLSHS